MFRSFCRYAITFNGDACARREGGPILFYLFVYFVLFVFSYRLFASTRGGRRGAGAGTGDSNGRTRFSSCRLARTHCRRERGGGAGNTAPRYYYICEYSSVGEKPDTGLGAGTNGVGGGCGAEGRLREYYYLIFFDE